MNQLKISIITPVYNGEHFIEACIKNVIKQNCPSAEHVIVVGGSTDKTVEIIQKYAEKYPHIRWISEKDRGQSEAMNKGIAMARGEIISFLNVDDFYEPNVFNHILEIFKTLPEPSFLAANCNVRDKDDNITGICKPKKLKLTDLLLGVDINPHPVNPTSYFYHKSLHKKAGLYKIEIEIAMDQEFIFRAVQKAHLKYIDETWGNFRIREGTKTNNDIKSREIVKRNRRVLRQYRESLCLGDRVIFIIKYLVYCKIITMYRRIMYYVTRPYEIPTMLRRKLGKIFK